MKTPILLVDDHQMFREGLRAILERTRLILMVDAWYEQLPAVLRQLPKDGLYVVVSDRFIHDDAGFREFVAANW